MLGQKGEDAAVAWYLDRGWTLLDRNWRDGKRGEIDVIVHHPTANVIVFCEVKTRASDRYGSPAEAVTPAKQARLRQLAAAWLRARDERDRGYAEVQFDVAAVMGGRVEIIAAAF